VGVARAVALQKPVSVPIDPSYMSLIRFGATNVNRALRFGFAPNRTSHLPHSRPRLPLEPELLSQVIKVG
jgi:hypothetical protein